MKSEDVMKGVYINFSLKQIYKWKFFKYEMRALTFRYNYMHAFMR